MLHRPKVRAENQFRFHHGGGGSTDLTDNTTTTAESAAEHGGLSHGHEIITACFCVAFVGSKGSLKTCKARTTHDNPLTGARVYSTSLQSRDQYQNVITYKFHAWCLYRTDIQQSRLCKSPTLPPVGIYFPGWPFMSVAHAKGKAELTCLSQMIN